MSSRRKATRQPRWTRVAVSVLRGRESPRTLRSNMHENREISSTPSSVREGQSVKALYRSADMHVLEKSDCAVVPVNQSNKEAEASAETGEGRAQMKENIDQPHMHPTQSGKGMSQGLDGVRRAARERRLERFTSLLHHLNVDLLRESSYAL
jgi:RNA-directed DNA polymerase